MTAAARPMVRDHHPRYVTVMAGICDITYRNKSRTTMLRYSTQQETVLYYRTALKSSHSLLISMFPGIKVNYAPLTGLELLDYNNPARRGISPSERSRIIK